MIRRLKLIILIILSSQFAFSQTNPAEVKLEKVYELIDKNKIDNAEKQLVDLLEKYPSFGKGWDLLNKIKYYNYEQAKKLPNPFENLSITTTDEDGKKIENDSLSSSILSLFSKMNPGETAYNDWLLTLRKATISSNTAYTCAINLRNALRSFEVDTLVSSKALKYFNKAEEEFKNKNYNKAAENYQRALEYQPDFYKALLYLGDSYYFTENYIEAIKNFKKCSDTYPFFLEPRKYLVDAYTKEGMYDKALEESIEALMVYPDLSIFSRMEDAVYSLGNRLTIGWHPRAVLPNTIDLDSNKLVRKDDTDLKESNSNSPWDYYTKALPKIESYCDDRGIITNSNSLTSSKYLEIYSWEEMLNNSDSEELAQAREMKSKGFLECYVFITCFHDDFYDQYVHYVKNNREKILDYYKTVTTSR